MIDTKTLAIFSDALKSNLQWERYRPQFEEWERNLPKTFMLGGGDRHVAPLVFTRDPDIPGLYWASMRGRAVC